MWGMGGPVETRWGDGLTTSLVGAHRPGEVFQAAALCMAEELACEGFRWVKSRKSLERRDGAGRWERIVLQPSRWNRSGAFVAFDVAQLIVQEARLGEWRTANHLLTVVRDDAVADTLCATSCIDMARVGFRNEVILTQADRRAGLLGALCDQVREIVVPWFASTRDPARLAQAVPEALLGPFAFGPDLTEFLVSRNERGQARLLIERILAFEPRQRDAFEQGRVLARQGSQSRPRWHAPETLGWTAAVLDLM
jgi:hypothetical protein